MKEKLLEIIHYRRKALPDGNSLCYKGEATGHWQILQEIPDSEEIVLFELPQKPAIID